MAVKKLKTPADYGNLQCRVSKEQLTLLTRQIKQIVKELNEVIKDDKEEYVVRKNEVILEALRVGLPLVRQKGIKIRPG